MHAIATQLFETMHHAVWPRILAGLTIMALLGSFHEVVRGGVQQGETRRVATAAHADRVWRCQALRVLHAGDSCLLRLSSPVLPQLQNIATVPPADQMRR